MSHLIFEKVARESTFFLLCLILLNFFPSILDQQQKQTIPFQGGVYLENFEGKVFIASGREIYSLVPVAWEKQVTKNFGDSSHMNFFWKSGLSVPCVIICVLAWIEL